jgi:hypothetical protein
MSLFDDRIRSLIPAATSLFAGVLPAQKPSEARARRKAAREQKALPA